MQEVPDSNSSRSILHVGAKQSPYSVPVIRTKAEEKAGAQKDKSKAPRNEAALQSGKAKLRRAIQMAAVANKFKGLVIKPAPEGDKGGKAEGESGSRLLRAKSLRRDSSKAKGKGREGSGKRRTSFAALTNVWGNNLQAKILEEVLAARRRLELAKLAKQ